jgi:hypothetical protein
VVTSITRSRKDEIIWSFYTRLRTIKILRPKMITTCVETIKIYMYVVHCSIRNTFIQRFFQIRVSIHHKSRRQVLCGCRKKLPRTSLQWCYIFSFGPSGSLSTALLSVENWVPLMLVLGAMSDVSFKYRLNQTESAIFMKFFCLMLPRDHFFPDVWKENELSCIWHQWIIICVILIWLKSFNITYLGQSHRIFNDIELV